MLRGLAAEEVLEEDGDGRVSLGGPGRLLLPGVPSSLRGAVTARADIYYRAAVGLLDAVRTGGTPFELVHGQAFFTRVPGGADAYLLSRVLHDWDDADALRVLQSCSAAMRPDSLLLVVEALVPERAVDDPAAVRMDLHMLVLLHGRERTASEYATLLDAAELQLTAHVPTGAGVHVLEARPR